eukprot:COSAG05_NODE_6938_length_878_cov_1.071887_1_plen_178_part_10
MIELPTLLAEERHLYRPQYHTWRPRKVMTQYAERLVTQQYGGAQTWRAGRLQTPKTPKTPADHAEAVRRVVREVQPSGSTDSIVPIVQNQAQGQHNGRRVLPTPLGTAQLTKPDRGLNNELVSPLQPRPPPVFVVSEADGGGQQDSTPVYAGTWFVPGARGIYISGSQEHGSGGYDAE